MYNFDPSIFISIHAPPRGATRLRKLYIYTNLFQFTPLREGRRACERLYLWREIFQFTPLREGRPLTAEYNPIENYISIHAPPRGATEILNGDKTEINFNSRPSARGDDNPQGTSDRPILISIHAPPRGATRRCDERLEAHPISIHAPPRGATNAQGRGFGN